MAEITSLYPTRDPKSPYYLNLGDLSMLYPSTKLSQTEDNYVFWKLRFHDFLKITNKTGFVDGTITKPEPSSPVYEPWNQCDAVVKLWLMNSMSQKLQESVMYAETAHQMWENVRGIFVPSVEFKIYQLRRSLATISQNGDSVEKYFGKLNEVWMELDEFDPVLECSCGGCKCDTAKRALEVRENEQRYTFLMGLNQSFSMVKTRIMCKKPPPSLFDAYIKVERAESLMKLNRK